MEIYLLTFLLVCPHFMCCSEENTRQSVNRHHLLALQRATLRHRERERLRYSTCTNSETLPQQHVHSNHEAVTRVKRSIALESPARGSDQSVHFGGNSGVMEWRPHDTLYPEVNFTIEAWIKPEGGQPKSVSIVGLFDSCTRHQNVPRFYWSLGISALTLKTATSDDPHNANFQFRIRSHKSYKVTNLSDKRGFRPNVWVHLAATYDGISTKFYINAAKVLESRSTWGTLFRNNNKCLRLRIGGDRHNDGLFRGEIKTVKLYSTTHAHSDIARHMRNAMRPRDPNYRDIVLSDNFNTFEQWQSVTGKTATLRATAFRANVLRHDIGLVVPPCGVTVCDDPEVVKSYVSNANLLQSKTLRYRVINVAKDNGSDPIVSQEQIRNQNEILKRVFSSYNISLKLEKETVHNDTLRNHNIFHGCEAIKVGNNECDHSCDHPLTGNDGGDCDWERLWCPAESIGNGVCDWECNRWYHNFDGGDCCMPATAHSTCFDPGSPDRIYMGLDEYKQRLGFENKKYVNVYFADWTTQDLFGVSTFPWDRHAHTELGGITLKPQHFGFENATYNLVHELGHALGLWHTFKGEVELFCNDRCLEVQPSLELGDLCSDTNPTTKNLHCREPDDDTFSCGLKKVGPTPYKNFMGYGGNQCAEEFTPQQVARMHCYLDLAHKSWVEGDAPSPIPLPPTVIEASQKTVTLSWVPTIQFTFHEHGVCSMCQEDLSLLQYASAAWSPTKANNTWEYGAVQATGAPDAPACEPSPAAWTAFDDSDNFVTDEQNFIELSFQVPVVTKRVYIWVTWNTAGIREVILYGKDGSTVHINDVIAYCDMPYTARITENIEVVKMRIYAASVFESINSIDAVALQSKSNYIKCKSCDQSSYVIRRSPPFVTNDGTPRNSIEVDDKMFIDRSVEEGVTYEYTVHVQNGGVESIGSPPLHYTHGEAFCGDGRVDSGEQCDDGNLRDGDGCSLRCHIELFFHCRGEPSLCYQHSGDGICEEFEKHSSVEDCGFFTPEGFSDQWATSAETLPGMESEDCPVSAILGTPPAVQTCGVELDDSSAWLPCAMHADRYSVTVYFRKPVVATTVIIYLGSDGMVDPTSGAVERITVELLGVNNESHPVGSMDVQIVCRNNPVHLNIIHDLSTPFFYTKGARITFYAQRVSISAVALRSYKYLDPEQLANSPENQLYHPHSGRLVQYECIIPECEPYKVRHGSANCNGNSDGDKCDITCNRGYLVSSSTAYVTCIEGEWHGDVRCVPVTCQEPLIPHAKVDCSDGYIFNSKCKFDCKLPAVKRGPESMIHCQSDGTWSLPEAYCEVMCSRPALKGGVIISTECDADELAVGTRCKVMCSRGYRMVGTSPKKRATRMTCDDQGEWDSPVCEKVTCAEPLPVYRGLYSCTDSFFYKSLCTLKCPGPNGATSTSICQQNRQWDNDFARCKFEVGTCPNITQPEGVIFNCSNPTIGSHCQASCNNTEEIPMLRYTSHVDGKVHIEPIESVLCTGTLEWYPRPSAVICAPACKREWIADRLCDSVNNHAICNWDGGDCCVSTKLGGGPVESLDCGDHCLCKDPNARENQINDNGGNLIRSDSALNHVRKFKTYYAKEGHYPKRWSNQPHA